jgi:excinuclease ABC subunit C
MLVDPETGRPRKFAYAPGLVVVDGGPPQVAAAREAMTELGFDDIPVCGLAKRLEEVWVPDQEDPVILPRSSEGLYLLQRVRDEAHRFAITYHKKLRDRRTIQSVLDAIPGIGPTIRTSLLKTLGSARRVREASVAELAAVPKVTPKLAQRIHDHFHATVSAAPSEAPEAEPEPEPQGGEPARPGPG